MAFSRGLAVLALCAACVAQAQVLYRWVDAQGKVQYSDQPPKGFDGKVTRIEPNAPATPARIPAPTPPPGPAAPVVPLAPAPEKPASATPGQDGLIEMAARKREARAKLRAAVDAARERADQARKALEEAREQPLDEERQVIQQRMATVGNAGTPQAFPNKDVPQSQATGGGMHGMTLRANCRGVPQANGKVETVCPTLVTKPEYFERVARLEEALKKAEEDLSAAEETYARNVD